jgi:hypothetical protein
LLQKFTIAHTDNYMKKSYVQLQKLLHPDSLFFLGDLFDGGREWKSAHGGDEEPAWAKEQRPKQEQDLVKTWRNKFGEDFWLQEYKRFGDIFFKHWNDGGSKPGKGQRARKIVAGLPGNHDLGFGEMIKIPVRNRFQAYFGETNRVDVLGNHTIVSVDTVSLSAKGDGEEHGIPTGRIYTEVEEFLRKVPNLKKKAVARELHYQESGFADVDSLLLPQEHKVSGLYNVDFRDIHIQEEKLDTVNQFPTILLTHVPLYRPPGKPCGPLREHYPPTPPPAGQTSPLDPDDRNALSIARGYQYQNVLSDRDSNALLESVGDVVHVFSGDDHDYCEVVHSDKGNVREITVKSFSWAMGVRRPGFLMVSLWNPVDAAGQPLGTHASGHGKTATPSIPTTMETHLCLLPDQLAVFIRYGIFAAVSLISLLVVAVLSAMGYIAPFAPAYESRPSTSSYLPMHNLSQTNKDTAESAAYYSHSTTSSDSSLGASNLAPRNMNGRTRSVSPHGGYGLPPREGGSSYSPPGMSSSDPDIRGPWERGGEKEGRVKRPAGTVRRKLGFWRTAAREMGWGVYRVVWVVVAVWAYLMMHG